MQPDKEEVFRRYYLKKRDKFLASNFAIYELDHLVYPAHKTAYVTLSKVPDPDVVVIYTYGGLVPHHFYKDENGRITDKTGFNQQFTYEWLGHWLDNNVAMVIFDIPDYFIANGHPWANSFYRRSKDRLREAKQLINIIHEKFPNSKITWAGLSFGAQEAALVSLEDTPLHKIANISATWHVVPDVDEHYQGARLNWYNVEDSKTPVLIVMHETEVFEKATLEMSKTDSILVANDVSPEDGHFFRGRQTETIEAICNWFRDKPYPKIIP